MNRTQARAPHEAVYEWEWARDGGEDTCRELLEIRPERTKSNTCGRSSSVRGKCGALDERIERFSHGWKLDRLPRWTSRSSDRGL
jgi:hypothetical protein